MALSTEAPSFAWLPALAATCFLFCIIVAAEAARRPEMLPWSEIHRPILFPCGTFQASCELVRLPITGLATLAALPIFAGRFAHELGGRGLPWFGVWVLFASLGWYAIAVFNNRRLPPVPFLVLLMFQVLGVAGYLDSFSEPTARLISVDRVMDFHVHTTLSTGLLTPQQQIDWHRARGFTGLAFTDLNSLMPEEQFLALCAANPDMLIVNGCEYDGTDHLLFLGLSQPVTAHAFDVPAAIAAAKRQGAVVIGAPLEALYPNSYANEQPGNAGIDGLEILNGSIFSPDLAQRESAGRLIGTAGSGALSRSGSQCFSWTLLPQGLHNQYDVLRALRLRKTGIVTTLSFLDSPPNYMDDQERLRGPAGSFFAARAAWFELSRLQRVNALLQLAAVLSLVLYFAAPPRRKTPNSNGPHRAMGYLRRRRLLPRLGGLMVMAMGVAGSIAVGLPIFGTAFGSPALNSWTALQSRTAFAAWFVLDALYLWGQSAWRKKHN